MSQENVKIVLALQPPPHIDHLQLWGNPELWSQTFAMFASHFQPDFETTGTVMGDEKTFVGSEGCREMMMEWYDPWASYRIESHAATDLDDRDQVLVEHDAFARSKRGAAESDREVKFTGASVYTFRDGKIARVAFYLDPGEARRAVGLAE